MGGDQLPVEVGGDAEPDEPGIAVVVLRGLPVILDAVVAQAFGVETREINQAVSRNLEKFQEYHVFQLNAEERAFLTSQGVISKPGRGGNRALPHVYTQKGVARLATILNTPQALRATDLIIDIFVEVHQQIDRGRRDVTIAQPSRLIADQHASKQTEGLRQKLFAAIEDLLDTPINRKKKATVRDALEALPGSALDFVNSHLNAKGIENQKLAAETMHILEQARALRDRTRADIDKSDAETERVLLENFEKKLAITERVQKMIEALEPSALVSISRAFLRPPLLIQGPPSFKELRPPDGDP